MYWREGEKAIASSWNLIYQSLPQFISRDTTRLVGLLVGLLVGKDTAIEREHRERERERGSFTDIINDCASVGCM